MPNVIALSGPNPTQQIVSQFLEQFNANRRADQANSLGRDQLAQQTQAQSDTASFQQGTLENARKTLTHLETVYNDTQMQGDADKVLARQGSYQDAINSLQPSDPQRAALEAQAKAELDGAVQAKPGLDAYLKIAGVKKVLGPAYQEQLATQGVKTGAAQGMQAGNPTPMQADVFSKENFKQGMSGPMVQDIQSRQPEAAQPAKGATASPTTDYYRGPALGLDTTAAQDQVAQTAITTEGMQQAGAMAREKFKANEANKGVSSLVAGAGGGTGGGDLSGASPLVRALVNRSADPRILTSRKWTPETQNALLGEIQKYDPNFNMADYAAQAATKKAFTSGAQSQNITAINTAIRHLSSLSDALDGLHNSSVPIYNSAANFVGQQTGNAGIQKSMSSVDKAADAVANELNKAFRGSGQMSEKETVAWRKGLGTSTTPAEKEGAIRMAAGLLAGRNEELQTAYQRGVGRPADIQFIGNGTQAILKKLGIADLFQAGSGGADAGGGAEVVTTHDGLKWKKNADGSMTQVP